MTDVNQLITDHLDIWTAATEKKSSAGRGNGGSVSLHGIKKLRELILELAVRGKLVPHDDTDVPADGLLDQLHLQQAQMFAKGIIKKPKPVAKIAASELPFELPRGWTWCRVSQLGHDWGQKVPESQFTYIDVGSINKELGLVSEPTVLEASNAPSRARKLVRNGTVVYSTVRPYLLNIAVITETFEPEPIASTAFAILHPFDGVSASYLYRYFRSPTFISYVEGCQTGIAYPAINDKQFFSGLVPLPPTAEQHRIVAKVDELMALCDALERQAEGSLKAHQTLVETCLATLTNSQSPEELTRNWTRIEAHFDTLFTTEESVARLETTVLELAIRGLLVSQDPSDEPAATWLERAVRTRDKLVKAKTIRKPKATKDVDGLPKPYPLPESWAWARLPEVGELARGKSKHRPRNDRRLFDGGEYPLVQTGDVARANPFIVESESFYNDFGLQQSRLWPSGTLCITIAANIADTGILSIDACFPDSVVGYIPFEDDVDVTYFDYFIRTAKNDLEHYAPSTAQKNINLEILGEVLVPLPPKAELNRICDRVSDLLKICKMLRQRIRDSKGASVKLADTLTSKIH
ncbi:restriction endonuclease subunit S [Tritonibacter sp. SIMBA_163]|uniref:restriction endonuclease subunit S n=1 Tax=Tritonibacter sp. SIMBA_163 TaxID=3080868 RepID=UPI0039802E98